MGKMKTALVAGGTGGIGRAISEKLRGEGYYVIACGKRDFDATDENNVARFFQDRVQTDNLDVLVNVIGGNPNKTSKKFMELSAADWRNAFYLNVMTNVFFTQRALALMRSGHIINISSIRGVHPIDNPHYASSKAAVNCLTKHLALAYPELRVNALVPDVVRDGGEKVAKKVLQVLRSRKTGRIFRV